MVGQVQGDGACGWLRYLALLFCSPLLFAFSFLFPLFSFFPSFLLSPLPPIFPSLLFVPVLLSAMLLMHRSAKRLDALMVFQKLRECSKYNW